MACRSSSVLLMASVVTLAACAPVAYGPYDAPYTPLPSPSPYAYPYGRPPSYAPPPEFGYGDRDDRGGSGDRYVPALPSPVPYGEGGRPGYRGGYDPRDPDPREYAPRGHLDDPRPSARAPYPRGRDDRDPPAYRDDGGWFGDRRRSAGEPRDDGLPEERPFDAAPVRPRDREEDPGRGRPDPDEREPRGLGGRGATPGLGAPTWR